jgi:hypothetical protein
VTGLSDLRHVLVALCATTAILALTTACVGPVEPGIVAGVDGCSRCGMVIDQPKQACGWIGDAEFVVFDSPACLLAAFNDLRKSGQAPPQEIYFADFDSGTFVISGETSFLLTDHVPTVMNGRVLCFATAATTQATQDYDDEIVTDWPGYRRLRGEPDVVVDTVFGGDGMEPEVVAVAKGELVLWRATGNDLDEDLTWVIKGYGEIEPVVVLADGEVTEVRFFATRPGAGFPIESVVGGEPLGMLKVSGPHTMDEAAQ